MICLYLEKLTEPPAQLFYPIEVKGRLNREVTTSAREKLWRLAIRQPSPGNAPWQVFFRLTRPGHFPNEWGESQNFTFNVQLDIKTGRIELPVESD